jgi:pimeloyl-ACP methyl ester carboxylesterase
MKKDQTFDGKNGSFHYIDWGGNGPLAHFSHATGLCAHSYTPLIGRITNHLRVLGMDDRGHGKTTAPADTRKLHNWETFIDDLDLFLSSFREPVIAMGHSRGAVVSMLLALRRPDLVRALILIDPTILPFSAMWLVYLAKRTGLNRYIPIAARAAKRNGVWPDRKTIFETYQTKSMFKTWEKGFLEAYIEDGTRETDDGRVKLSCEPTWEARCFSVYPHDLWRYVPAIQQPTLVLYGEKSDTFLGSAAKRFQSKVPQAQIRCFKNTSHFVPMEKPVETARAIRSFVKGCSFYKNLETI